MGDPVTSTVLSVASIAQGIESAKYADDMADVQKESAAQAVAANKVEAARARRENVRRQRIQAAQVEAAGASEGTSGSSGALAVADMQGAAVSRQTAGIGAQMKMISNQAALQNQMTNLTEQHNKFQAIAGTAASLSGTALSFSRRGT